jgi:hypothetical protein
MDYHKIKIHINDGTAQYVSQNTFPINFSVIDTIRQKL